jgi:hypothetical protein
MSEKKKVSACGKDRICNYPYLNCNYFKCCSCSLGVCLFLDEEMIHCLNDKAWPESNLLCDKEMSYLESSEEMKVPSDCFSKMDSFREVTKSVMEWIKKNHDPGTKVLIDCTSAEILISEMSVYNKDEKEVD